MIRIPPAAPSQQSQARKVLKREALVSSRRSPCLQLRLINGSVYFPIVPAVQASDLVAGRCDLVMWGSILEKAFGRCAQRNNGFLLGVSVWTRPSHSK